MPRYFMHLHDGVDKLLDDDGSVLPADDVPKAALEAARDCIAGDVRKGRIDLRAWIDVEDDTGVIVHTLPFYEAVEVIRD